MAIPCPTCGATNAEGADWCNQCYRPLVAELTSPEPVPPVVEDTPSMLPEPGPSQPADGLSPTWTCSVCEEANDVDASICGTCGTSIYAAFSPAGARPDAGVMQRWSVVPGGGHAKAGEGLTGLAIFLTVAMAVGFGLLLLGAAATRWLGFTIMLVGGGTWVASAYDVQQSIQSGGPWIMQPRVISGIAGGVLGLLFIAVLLAIR